MSSWGFVAWPEAGVIVISSSSMQSSLSYFGTLFMIEFVNKNGIENLFIQSNYQQESLTFFCLQS